MDTLRSSDALTAAELISSVETWLPTWPHVSVTQADLEAAYAAAPELDKKRVQSMMRSYAFTFLFVLMKADYYAPVPAGKAIEWHLRAARGWLEQGDRSRLPGKDEYGWVRGRKSDTYWSFAKDTAKWIYAIKHVVEALIPSQ